MYVQTFMDPYYGCRNIYLQTIIYGDARIKQGTAKVGLTKLCASQSCRCGDVSQEKSKL